MTLKRKYDLVVFDWDGTLMDSEARIVACMQAAMRETGLPLLDAGAIRHIIGLGLYEAVSALYPQAVDDDLQRLMKAYRHHYLVVDNSPMTLFEGVAEVVRTLRERDIMLAVATGKSRAGLARALDESGIESYFYATRCAEETCSKPDPMMLNEIMLDLDVAPSRTLMVGDSIYDLQMAANAKVDALAVSYGVHHCDQLREHKPLGCIDTLPQLLEWVS